RHHGVKRTAAANSVVIAAKHLARGAAGLGHLNPRRQIEEVERIWGAGRQRARGDFLLQCLLDFAVRNAFVRRGGRQDSRANPRPVTDLLPRYAVFAELIEKLTT